MFITDICYDSNENQYRAFKYINNFFDSLAPTDDFGLICLGKKANNLEITL